MENFGPFRLVHPLGEGGMGEVFLARTPWPTNPLAAVKRLHADAYHTEKFVKRFEHEAQLAVRLRHPHVVSALDVGVIDERLYVASELIVGRDVHALATKLGDKGLGAPPAVAVWVLSELLDALTYVHGALDNDGCPLHLIHRDVTPRNILLDYNGITKLADFGLAKSTLTEQDALTGQNSVLGTPSYIPPETMYGQRPTQAIDLYGIGTALYTLLTSLPPYWGDVAHIMNAIASEPPHPLAELRPDLPSWFVAMINQLIARSPEERPEPAELRKILLQKARKDRLLAPRRTIQKWLKELFQDERRAQEEIIATARKATPADRFANRVIAHIGNEMALRSIAHNPIDYMPERPTLTDEPEKHFEDEDTLALTAMKPRPVCISSELEAKLQGFAEPLLSSMLDSARTSASSSSPPFLFDSQRTSAPSHTSEARSKTDISFDSQRTSAPDRPLGDSQGTSKTLFVPPVADSTSSQTVPTPPGPTPYPPRSPTIPTPAPRPWLQWITVTLAVALVFTGLAFWSIQAPKTDKHTQLEKRYYTVSHDLLERKKANLPVPDRAWTLSTEIANALIAKDYETVEAILADLESLLAASE